MTPEFGTERSALVTGGARRIGAAFARALGEDGWHVLIHCNRSQEEAEALAGEIAASGGRASVLAGELADPELPARLVRQAAAVAPPLGLLVNNASLFEYDQLEDFGPEQWARHMDVNLRAPALLIQAFAAALPEGARGLVVNLLDVKLFALNPDYFTYTISKYGLLGLTELAARALAPRIRVCGIAPAVTLVSGPRSRAEFERAHVHNPLGRGVDSADLVAALRFIVAVPTLTAEVITVDAGQRLMRLPRDVGFMVAGDETRRPSPPEPKAS